VRHPVLAATAGGPATDSPAVNSIETRITMIEFSLLIALAS